MSYERLTRKRLLLLAAAAMPATAGAAGLLWSRRDGDDARADSFAGGATSFIDDLDAARRLGRLYLDEHPEEAGELRLARLFLASSPDWSQARAPVDRELMRTLAHREARSDFAGGRVAPVGGWYLSRTEARLCALATYA